MLCCCCRCRKAAKTKPDQHDFLQRLGNPSQ
jgi:hypothetical protein